MSESVNQSYSLVSTQEIYGILRKLSLSQQDVSIRVGKATMRYFTKIVSVNLDALSFNLDYLSPEEGNNIIAAGERFHIDAQYQGARISFRVDKRMSYQLEQRQYRVEFPSEITYLQRRDCYRVEQGVGDISVCLGNEIHPSLTTGHLLDLSATGFKAAFELTQEMILKAHKDFPCSALILPDGRRLKLALARHYSRYDKRHICIGFRIKNIAPMEQRYLEQQIQQLQWQQRQMDDYNSTL